MFSQRTSAGALRGLARPQARCPRWQCSSSSRASFASSSTAHAQSSHSFATAGTRHRLAWAAGLAGMGASLYGYNLHLSSTHSNALSLDSDSLPNTAPLAAKRASYSDRIKAHKGGPIELIRTRERQEDIEQEHDVENSAESHSGELAVLGPHRTVRLQQSQQLRFCHFTRARN
ncbi:hypothetical protein IE81DRAFT_124943 [Ceraceosorus guamensis]|uniref:Uncharacterized protein n=1 Tax=Ceraceosorus guamensis TaxID=1522189 RepID=A0A316W1S4_9BASI|nr:hypothetical protein IE81DRAFT_124943 [Ceraceosorus guamensis]PWN42501.1 hypothetical protein IE81DRAFT_124943 [Ceraceosorus guamensis]